MASAALKKYSVNRRTLIMYAPTSPVVEYISGGRFCHSVPSYVCDLATAQDLATVSTAAFLSSNYDVGTWTIHGTGFLHPGGYINRTGQTDLGNSQFFLLGAVDTDGTVPALPLLGIGAVGVSVFAMGVASLRRRRE